MPAFSINAILTSVEWSSDYQNVRDWSSVAARLTYLETLNNLPVTLQSNELSQVRKGGSLKISTCETGETPTDGFPSLAQLEKINYMYFDQDGRTWFYFVDSVDYIGVRQARLNISLDYWQTYYFDFTLEKCFVERGHVREYAKNGRVLLDYCQTPENVDVGEQYTNKLLEKIQRTTDYTSHLTWLWIVATEDLFGFGNQFYGEQSPLYTFVFPFDNRYAQSFNRYFAVDTYTDEVEYCTPYQIQDFIKNHSKAIIGCYITANIPVPYTIKIQSATKVMIAPRGFIGRTYNFGTASTRNNKTILYPNVGEGTGTSFGQSIYNTNYNFDKSKPVKAQCYPYKYWRLCLDRGHEYIIKPQIAGTDLINVYYYLSIGAKAKEGFGCGLYGNKEFDLSVNNTINEYPVKSQDYATYIQESKASEKAGLVSMGLSLGKGIAGGAASAIMGATQSNPWAVFGGVSAAIGSGISFADKMQQHFAKLQDLKDQPDELKKCGNDYLFEMICGTNGVTLYETEITEEQSARLCNYFGRMGYTIKDVIKYDTRSKQYYNYVQTVEAAIVGNIPTDAKRQLRRIFDSGVTIWHEGSTMYDYKETQDDVWA